ncbi:MAG: hypothetical protein GY703_05325, partial [Gammaproteobacteria bacterium]|nr:hypothetical protein [Gammaproteobacteria bacterium]
MCTPSQPSLTLRKVVINDNGGIAVPSNWVLNAVGPSSFSGRGPQVSSGDEFLPGVYTLSESGGPENYLGSDWVCTGGTQDSADSITLESGESATCTITNDDVSQGVDINAGHSGAWFDPVTSGQGLFIDAVDSEQFMFLSWFTYTDSESDHPFEQRWFTAQGSFSGDTANLILYETLGGKFDDPQAVTTVAVGNVSVRFSSCYAGRVTYTIDGENLQGNFPIQRVIGNSSGVCEQ